MAVIKSYQKPTKANPFVGAVTELIEAGEGAADEQHLKTRGESVTYQSAARAAGFTARIVEKDPEVEGETGPFRYVFILAPLRERKPAEDAKVEPETPAGK